jgi:hypothetical protein
MPFITRFEPTPQPNHLSESDWYLLKVSNAVRLLCTCQVSLLVVAFSILLQDNKRTGSLNARFRKLRPHPQAQHDS